MKIDKDVICKNTTRIYHNYRVWDKVMTLTKSAYKYDTPFKVLYEIVQTWKNVTVSVVMGAVTMRINIRNIEPYNTSIVEEQYPS